MTPFLAELIGTFLLIVCGAGVCANVILKGTKGNSSGWIVITTGWALGVYIGVVVAGPVSYAHLNPAVTLGFALAGMFPWSMVGSYILAQMLGAAAGALVIWIFYRHHFNATDDAASKLAVFCTAPAIRRPANNLFSEVVGTFVLMFVIFYIVDGRVDLTSAGGDVVKVGLGSVGAIPVAFVVWVVGLALGGTTGYAINPARDLAPRLMHCILPIKGKGSSDWGYSWIPVVGPFAGAAIAALLFVALR